MTGWLRHGDRLRSARFSPDGLRVVTSAEDRTARVWDAFNGQPWTERFAHGRRLTWAEFSADGERVVTSSEDSSAGIWDVRPNRASRRRVSYGFVITNLVQSADGARLLVGLAPFEGVATSWLEVNTLTRVRGLFVNRSAARRTALSIEPGRSVGVGRVGRRRLAGLGHRLRNAARRTSFARRPHPSGGVQPGSTWVVTAGTNRVAQIWEVASGARVGDPLVHKSDVRCARFSPDGRSWSPPRETAWRTSGLCRKGGASMSCAATRGP